MRADLTTVEVNTPSDRLCSTGHIVDEICGEGQYALALPIRFFKVSGLGINGIFCENCISAARKMAALAKQK